LTCFLGFIARRLAFAVVVVVFFFFFAMIVSVRPIDSV
jgi:hypothetical protein